MNQVNHDPRETQPSEDGLHAASFPQRSRLPDTRESVTHKFSISGHEGYLTVGLYEDGRPGELFIKMSKQGSTMSGLMDTIGILTSLALQHGVPVETLSTKLEHQKFEPSGWTPHAEIGEASSVVDYVFRWLGITFPESFRRFQEHDAEADSSKDKTHSAESQ